MKRFVLATLFVIFIAVFVPVPLSFAADIVPPLPVVVTVTVSSPPAIFPECDNTSTSNLLRSQSKIVIRDQEGVIGSSTVPKPAYRFIAGRWVGETKTNIDLSREPKGRVAIYLEKKTTDQWFQWEGFHKKNSTIHLSISEDTRGYLVIPSPFL